MLRIDEVFADPQVQHLDMTRTVDDPTGRPIDVLRPPLTFSDTPATVRRGPPAAGAQTREVLSEIGYDDAEIDDAPRARRSRGEGRAGDDNVTTTDIDTGTEKMLARVEDGIGWMTYNNPARLNAMSVEMTLAVPRILRAFRDNPDVRVIVVTGAGTRAFVSGADISEFGERRTSVDARASTTPRWPTRGACGASSTSRSSR